jgi:hypothetical protein
VPLQGGPLIRRKKLRQLYTGSVATAQTQNVPTRAMGEKNTCAGHMNETGSSNYKATLRLVAPKLVFTIRDQLLCDYHSFRSVTFRAPIASAALRSFCNTSPVRSNFYRFKQLGMTRLNCIHIATLRPIGWWSHLNLGDQYNSHETRS